MTREEVLLNGIESVLSLGGKIITEGKKGGAVLRVMASGYYDEAFEGESFADALERSLKQYYGSEGLRAKRLVDERRKHLEKERNNLKTAERNLQAAEGHLSEAEERVTQFNKAEMEFKNV
jgi:hypothetical protein